MTRDSSRFYCEKDGPESKAEETVDDLTAQMEKMSITKKADEKSKSESEQGQILDLRPLKEPNLQAFAVIL
jgi:hypothetical protein